MGESYKRQLEDLLKKSEHTSRYVYLEFNQAVLVGQEADLRFCFAATVTRNGVFYFDKPLSEKEIKALRIANDKEHQSNTSGKGQQSNRREVISQLLEKAANLQDDITYVSCVDLR